MALKMPSVALRSGGRMPQLGLGTGAIGSWSHGGSGGMSRKEAMGALDAALEAGYRHFDTATMYQNEALVGEALHAWISTGRLKREDVFVTTKLPNNAMRKEDVSKFMLRSLEHLQLFYVDLYLVHSPVGTISDDDDVAYPKDENGNARLDLTTDLEAVWAAVEEQVDLGRAKAIGLSSFNSKQIERILKVARIPPANLQIEVHAYLQQRPLRKLCAAHNITVCGFMPIGAPHRAVATEKHPKLLEHPTVVEISERVGRTCGQVLLRHLIQHGIIVIPKSVNPERIASNAKVFDFELSKEDMTALDGLDRGPESRISNLLYYKGAAKHPEFPYHLPF